MTIAKRVLVTPSLSSVFRTYGKLKSYMKVVTVFLPFFSLT